MTTTPTEAMLEAARAAYREWERTERPPGLRDEKDGWLVALTAALSVAEPGKDDDATFEFLEPDACSERDKRLAACVVNQQRAGFKNTIDARESKCPNCGASGFNTGWGFLEFTCGAEFLTDGEESNPCRSPSLSVAEGRKEGEAQAAWDVLAERRRQIEQEGWTAEHDDAHRGGSIARAAAAYCLAGYRFELPWPSAWDWKWFKPTTKRRNLVKAGALILAEIERLDRAQESSQ